VINLILCGVGPAQRALFVESACLYVKFLV